MGPDPVNGGPRRAPSTAMAQVDRCPFHRGLGQDFQGCAAFQPSQYMAMDLQYHAAKPVWTCHSLEIGSAGHGEFYPACALGTPERRAEWVARMQSERMELFRTLQVELGEAIRAHVLEILEAKSARLARGESLHPEDDAEVGELVRLAMMQVDTVLQMRSQELQRLRVPAAACRDLVEWVLLEIGRRDDFAFPAFPQRLLERVPPEVADMLAAFRG